MPFTSEAAFAPDFTVVPGVGLSGRLCLTPPAGFWNALKTLKRFEPLKERLGIDHYPPVVRRKFGDDLVEAEPPIIKCPAFRWSRQIP